MRIGTVLALVVFGTCAMAQDQPTVSSFVVAGNVVRPGVYPLLNSDQSNTVTGAIGQARGLARYAGHTAYIDRKGPDGSVSRIVIPLWDILQRRTQDVHIQGGDVLTIPEVVPSHVPRLQPGAPDLLFNRPAPPA